MTLNRVIAAWCSVIFFAQVSQIIAVPQYNNNNNQFGNTNNNGYSNQANQQGQQGQQQGANAYNSNRNPMNYPSGAVVHQPGYQNSNPQQQQQHYQQNGQYQRPPGYIQPMNPGPVIPNGSNGTGTGTGGGTIVTLQLKSYSDPGWKLPNGMTCACPQGITCSFLRTVGPQCWFSFTTILSTPDQSVSYQATEFVPLDNFGNVDLTRSTVNWTAPQQLSLSSKPSALDIFVHHLGVVISPTGQLMNFNNLVHVDTFIVPLTTLMPTTGTGSGNNLKGYTVTGQLTGTTLSLQVGVSCSTQLIGPNCDLSCTPSASDTQTAVCTSNITGYYSICKYQSGGQVTSCQQCPYGVASGSTTCQGTITTVQNVGVSSAFRTWTIILGCLFGLSLLVILALIVAYCIIRRNEYNERPYANTARQPVGSYAQPPAVRQPLMAEQSYPIKTESDWGGYNPPRAIHPNNNQMRPAPMADHEGSRHSHSTRDEDDNSSVHTRPSNQANGHPVAIARRVEAQV